MADENQEGNGSVTPAPTTPPESSGTNPFFGPSQSEVVAPQPVTSAAPSASDSAPVNPSKPPRQPLTKMKKLILIGAGVALLLVGGGLWFFLAGPGSESALEREFRLNSPYEYKPALTNLEPDHRFEFKHSLKISEDAPVSEVDKYMAVFSDAALTKPAVAGVFLTDDSIDIAPTDHIDASDPVGGEDVRISNDEEWGLHSQYYIVQYVNLGSGEKLKKPLVTPFSVQKEIETPVVSFTPDENGLAHFSWTPVEGADSYYIVKLVVNKETAGISSGENIVLGQTEDTEWTYDSPSSAKDTLYERQNYGFKYGRFTDDDLLDPLYLESAEARALEGLTDGDPNYGVIAVADDQFSSLGTVDAQDMMGQLPLEIADNTKTKMGIDQSVIDSFDKLPTHMPIVMVDNSVALRPVIIDTKNTTKNTQSIFTVGQGWSTTIDVPYKVQGTQITGKYKVTQFKDATYEAEVARIATRNIEAQDKTGALALGVITERPDFSKIKASTTKPSVPYKINATNPLTAYLAANMIKGEKYIDISAYVTENNPIDPMDAIDEAISQNPYITYESNGSRTYIKEKKSLVIDYGISAEDMVKKQQALSTEAKRVIAEIIKPGMNDTQKAQAINDYIVTSAAYDFDAISAQANSIFGVVPEKYLNAWSPAGILIDKRAVCAGYAEAFKLLADTAGMESVYVSGLGNATPHAWNKVKINGAWRVIDTTWNDGGGKSNNDYFLLTDAQAKEKRTNKEDKRWVVDALISNYAAR